MSFEKMKVLICDDSLLARKNLRDGLKILGCTDITEVYDGKAAVESCKQTEYDVVFLDIVMPVMDGITAAREICQSGSKAFVIIVSSVGTQVHLREAIKAGAQDFLQKPATPEQIRTALEHVSGGEEE